MEIVNKDIIGECFPERFNIEFNLHRVPFKINHQRNMIRKCYNKALKTKKVYIKELGKGEREFKEARIFQPKQWKQRGLGEACKFPTMSHVYTLIFQ